MYRKAFFIEPSSRLLSVAFDKPSILLELYEILVLEGYKNIVLIVEDLKYIPINTMIFNDKVPVPSSITLENSMKNFNLPRHLRRKYYYIDDSLFIQGDFKQPLAVNLKHFSSEQKDCIKRILLKAFLRKNYVVVLENADTVIDVLNSFKGDIEKGRIAASFKDLENCKNLPFKYVFKNMRGVFVSVNQRGVFLDF